MAITLATTLPSGTDVQELSANASGGARVGASSSELVSFHGATATDQFATKATVTVSNTITVLVDAVNAILDLLKEKGLMASS
jgi:hypothetical protein